MVARATLKFVTCLFVTQIISAAIPLSAQTAPFRSGAPTQDRPPLERPSQSPFYAVYGPLRTQKFIKMQYMFKQNKTLEQLADMLSAHFPARVPPIGLTFQECGKSTAFFNFQSRTLVLCYELLADIAERAFQEFANTPEVANERWAGAFSFVFFHELGHALIHSLNLPITGREEDVADQIATYIGLSGDGGVTIIQSGVWFFSKRELFYTRQHWADEHSLNAQRQFNIICWAYGKDPRLYTPLAQSLSLPFERARKCQGEYAQMARSIEVLFRDYWGNEGNDSAFPKQASEPSERGNVKGGKLAPPKGFSYSRVAVNSFLKDLCGDLLPVNEKVLCYKRGWHSWVTRLERETMGAEVSALDADSDVQGPARTVLNFPDKTTWVVFSGCRPHSCRDAYAYFLVDPKSRKMNIIWRNETGIRYFGPNAALLRERNVGEWLDRTPLE